MNPYLGFLPQTVGYDHLSTTLHECSFRGLSPEVTYWVSLGRLTSDNCWMNFTTTPVEGDTKRTTFWALGDMGTLRPEQNEVRDAAYKAFEEANRYRPLNDTRPPVDHILLLGDNAYDYGLQQEYQMKLFDVYEGMFSSVPIWPTVGNHDTYSGQTPHPYHEIFTTPMK
eukprot:gene18025-21466_t